MENKSLFNKWFWGNWKVHMQMGETRLLFVPVYKINSQWIKYINIRPKTINFIKKNIGTQLMNFGLRENFMNLTPKARELKAKLNV